jgi:hypothetical protein
MKKLIPITTALFLLFSSGLVSSTVAAEPSADEAQAVASVQAYMGALIAGDIAQMRAHLAPGLLAERKALLDNPTYSQHLQNAYGDASFEVVDQLWVGSDKVRVDVKIQLNPADAVHSRFELIRIGNEYRISTER